jgi:iron complex transport system substrate-binding protein
MLWFVALMALLLLPTSSVAQTVQVLDDLGLPLQFSQPAQRVVSLAPHNTENLFAAGAGSKLIGVSQYSDFPPPARGLAQIGSANNFDLEAIAALKPDLLVAWSGGNPRAQVERLAALHIPVFWSEPRSLDDIPRNIEALGALAGTRTTADAVARGLRAQIAALRAQSTQRAPVSVFYEMWDSPLMTVNGRHIISDGLAVCGARNVFAELRAIAPTVSIEAVLIRNPQVIVVHDEAQRAKEWIGSWQRFPQLRAVREQRFIILNADAINRPTPRMIDEIGKLCATLGPLTGVVQNSSDK